ncbi:MAG: hypothetical protein L0323_08970 [Planctomycetes bacterium]|nr:hypothetical protein [Planctomycetota bacterium]
MRARAFWKTVAADGTGFLDRLIALLAGRGIRYCVVGGQGVNAYVEPLVSLDLDLVVAADQQEEVEKILLQAFKVERFPHSLNVSEAGSELRVQIQTDPRYAPFVGRSAVRSVLGVQIPVARLEDVLQGKVWAAMDPTRRRSKRQKDLADIARILDARPELRDRVPSEILSRLI